jgi:hypothetical protein
MLFGITMSYIHSRGFHKLSTIKNNKPDSSSDVFDIENYLGTTKGSIVYVCNSAIRKFFYNVLPHITEPFTLVSGDSDDAMPYDKLSYSEFETMIRNDRICHWFCQNLLLTHPKMTHLPIGIDYHTLENHIGIPHPWGIGTTAENQERALRAIAATGKPWHERIRLCYSNWHHVVFGIGERGDRQEAIAQIPREVMMYDTFRNREDSWRAQINYAFVVSPRGGGYDCHRTWEALLLGCIPIVKQSGLDPVYDGLPVLIVHKWSDITPELLENTLRDFATRQFNYEKLQISYWASAFSFKN